MICIKVELSSLCSQFNRVLDQVSAWSGSPIEICCDNNLEYISKKLKRMVS